jgi:hypothetical protein
MSIVWATPHGKPSWRAGEAMTRTTTVIITSSADAHQV